MTMTFAEIAARMDPVEPPQSLRELAARHRWLTGDPPHIISLQDLVARHDNPATTLHDLLWYNTFLLQGLQLSPCKIPEMLEHLIIEAGFDPRALIDTLGLGPAAIIDRMGWSKSAVVGALKLGDKVKGTFSDVVSGILDAAAGALDWAAEKLGIDDVSVEDVLDKVPLQRLVDDLDITVDQLLDGMNVDPVAVLAKFCEETLDAVSNSLPGHVSPTIEVKPKPERQQRADEIGQVVAPDYEIVALCEVFEKDTQDRIVSHAELSGRQVHYAVGPDDSGVLVSSGLLSLALDRTIVGEPARHVFTARGQYCCDSDAWANKGVLLTVIDVGLGHLEIFSTHLLSGGDIADFLSPSDAETFQVQQQQVGEVIDFYTQWHDPRNVGVIVGDFNISAQDTAKYDWLVGTMHEKGMLDAWNHHRHRASPSSADNALVPPGFTHATGTGQATVVSLPGAPSVLGTGDSSAVGEVCVPSDGRFCVDGQEPVRAASKDLGRIDYVFFENPTPAHSYTLDFTRLRRRPFSRTGSQVISELWLSDHLGLDLTLVISPRP